MHVLRIKNLNPRHYVFIAWLLLLFTLPIIIPVNGADPIGVDQDEFWNLIINTDPNLILLIDNRPPSYYEDAHIPGAINVPLQVDSSDYLKPYLPKYSGTKILIYCNCGQGQNAHYQGNQFIELGYDPNNIYYLAESFVYWKYAVISGPDPGQLPRAGESYQTLANSGGSNGSLVESLLVAIGAIAIGAGALILVSSVIPRHKSSKVKINAKK